MASTISRTALRPAPSAKRRRPRSSAAPRCRTTSTSPWTAGEHFGLCVIPLPGMDGFVPGHCDERYVPGQLFSLSRKLVDAVTAGIVQLFDSDPLLHGPYDVAFGHEVSERVCEAVTRRLGVADVYFPTHRRYGNTVSGSVPLGMSTALREGRLKRGDRVLIIIG